MYFIVAGGGKVGANVARSLLRLGQEYPDVLTQRMRWHRNAFELLEGPLTRLQDARVPGDVEPAEVGVLHGAGVATEGDVVVGGHDQDLPATRLLTRSDREAMGTHSP